MKTYSVLIDMKYSKGYNISAKSKSEARKKAWERFLKRVPKKIFTTYVDER